MGGDGQFTDILFFALVAAFLILRLRSVLGRKPDDDQDEAHHYVDQHHRGQESGGNVVDLSGKQRDPAAFSALSPHEQTMLRIQDLDPQFTQSSFEQGATLAFEMIVEAFANGDKKTLEPLLSPDVYKSFAQAIDDRKDRKENMETEVVGVISCEVVDASLEGKKAAVTVKIVSDQVNVVRDDQAEVVEGDPTLVDRITDIWTFERVLGSRNPNWLLSATRTE